MNLRQYRPEDCLQLARLFYETVHTVNAADYTQAQLNAWACGQVDLAQWNESFLRHYTIIAEETGKILGFGDMDASGYLECLYVDKNSQGQGIATRICDILEHQCASSRIWTQASITAVPFFEQRGYQILKKQSVLRRGIELTNYVMEKRIAPDILNEP